MELEAIDFDLRDCLGDTVRALAMRAHEKQLELAFHVPPEVPEILIGDPGRLRQIVINLVGNSIKFTEKGEVVVDVRLESLTDEEVQLHFAVRDTGIGIPADKRQLIFGQRLQSGRTLPQPGILAAPAWDVQPSHVQAGGHDGRPHFAGEPTQSAREASFRFTLRLRRRG